LILRRPARIVAVAVPSPAFGEFPVRFLILLPLMVILVAGGVARSDEGLPEIESSAFFQTFDDSLGYDEFRGLPAPRQLDLRKTAREWISRSKDAVLASRGLDPASRQRASHAVTLLERQNALESAFNAAATAVGYCPYMAEAWLQYAEVAVYLGQYRTALACLAHAEKTVVYERSERTQRENLVSLHRIRSRAAYNVNDFESALESALYVIERDSGAWETRLLAARCMVQLERFDEARNLIATFPRDSPSHATALAVLGVAEMEAGNLEGAERAFDRAAEKGLRDPTFENDRGRLYLELGRYDDAIRHFRRAKESTPRFYEAASNIGVAQRRAGDLEASEATLTLLIEEAPEYAPAHLNLAEVYRDRAEAAEGAEREEFARRAWREYNLALEFGADPDRVLTRRATLSVFVDDLEAAEEDLLSLSGDPSVSVRVLTMLARVKKEQGRLDIAEQILAMATAREDATALAFAELGEVRLRRQDPTGAREALERACMLDPALVISRVNLSIACASLDDLDAARAALDEAARIDPDHPLVLEQQRALRERDAH
jgi:tetratricopeptide (TPR) repeat protein